MDTRHKARTEENSTLVSVMGARVALNKFEIMKSFEELADPSERANFSLFVSL